MILGVVSGAQLLAGRSPEPTLVQTTDNYYHVRVRPKGAFEELRTTQASADQATALIGAGADVREGRLDSGAWVVESVLVPLDAAGDDSEAEALVEGFVAHLEA